MPKLLAVAREELSFHLQQWSFYLSLAVMVGMFAAIGAFPQLRQAVAARPLGDVETVFTVQETVTTPTGFVDYSGLLTDLPPEQNLLVFGSEEDATAALHLGEIDRYYVITPDYIESVTVREYSLDAQLIVGSDSAISLLLRKKLLQQLPDPYLAERLQTPSIITYDGPPIPTFSFVPADLDTSQLVTAGVVSAFFTFLINISGALLLRALQRESEARVFEIVITSTSPAQFIGGKLLGLSLLVMGQATLTLLAGLLVYGRSATSLGPAQIPPHFILIALPYLLLGYLAYSGTMLCVAALIPNFAESSQLQFMVRLISILPMIGVVFILPNADGATAVWLTMLPFFSPLLMPFRVLITAVPVWQILLSLSLQLLWAMWLIWLSTRLFRMYSLLTGRTPVLRAVWAAARGR
jgi:ABC-2 type transport system permease protein